MSEAPEWLRTADQRLRDDPPQWFTQFAPPPGVTRHAAVLMLLGEGRGGRPEIVLTERASTMRSHAGQISFPGGKLEPGEGPVKAALRETHEEVGIEPDTIEVVGSFPGLYLTPSQNAVVPVLGWWREPGEVRAVDPAEVERAVSVPIDDLVDPRNRFTVRGPRGYSGPGFEAQGLFVWGFTAQLLSVLLDVCELAGPWDVARRRRLPVKQVWPYLRPGGSSSARR